MLIKDQTRTRSKTDIKVFEKVFRMLKIYNKCPKNKQKKNLTKRKNFNLCLVKIIGIDVFLNVLQKEGATEIFTLSYGGSVGKEHI